MWMLCAVVLLMVGMLCVHWLARNRRRVHAREQEELAQTLARLGPEAFPALAEECREGCRRLFDVDLDPERWEETAQLLDDFLRHADKRKMLIHGFSRPDSPHYWVLLFGAFLGDMLRRHTHGHWKSEEGASPAFEIETGGGPMTAFPFLMVQKHSWEGDSGDLVSFIHMLVRLDRLAAKRRTRQEASLQ